MRHWFFSFLFLIAVPALAQSTSDIDSASYVWLKNARLNFYIQPYYEQAPVLEETAGNVGLSWGVMVNDKVTAGTFVSVKVDNTRLPIIFPNPFSLNMVHGGLQLGYFFPLSKRLSVGSDFRVSYGEMEVSFLETGIELASARFNMIQPGIVVEYHIFRYARMYLSGSYRKMSGLDLNAVSEKGFNGVTMQLGLKLGFFRRIKWDNDAL